MGIIYAAVMGLTNTSLHLTSVNLHVILRMTVIVWVVGKASPLSCLSRASHTHTHTAGAWVFQGERPSLFTLLCCAGLVAGTILASWSERSGFGDDGAAVISITLLSGVAQAAMIVGMKWALTALNKKAKASLEIVAIKMTVATLVLLPVSLALDLDGWTLFGGASQQAHLLVSMGVFVTASFQCVIVAIQTLSLATSAGFLASCVIVPQVIISLCTNDPPFVDDALHILGYIVSPLSASAYAAYRLYMYWRNNKEEKKRRLLDDAKHIIDSARPETNNE